MDDIAAVNSNIRRTIFHMHQPNYKYVARVEPEADYGPTLKKLRKVGTNVKSVLSYDIKFVYGGISKNGGSQTDMPRVTPGLVSSAIKRKVAITIHPVALEWRQFDERIGNGTVEKRNETDESEPSLKTFEFWTRRLIVNSEKRKKKKN